MDIRIQSLKRWMILVLVLFLMLCSGIGLYIMEQSSDSKVKGRLLEACSCSVPCTCNFGGAPTPHHFCESLAFFELQSGKIDKVSLRGLRFALAGRGGSTGVVYLDSSLSKEQAEALKKIAGWILSLEQTPVTDVLRAPIAIEFNTEFMRGAVLGTANSLTALPLAGSDGSPSIVVSHPWIFGSFPVTYAQKGVTRKLTVRVGSLNYDYDNTNANNGVFEFDARQVK
jgi:hypothetical protein